MKYSLTRKLRADWMAPENKKGRQLDGLKEKDDWNL
jgi:hypothetical protein